MCIVYEKLPEFKVRHSCFAPYCSIDIRVTAVILQTIIYNALKVRVTTGGALLQERFFNCVDVPSRDRRTKSSPRVCAIHDEALLCVPSIRFDRPSLFYRFALTTFWRENIYEDECPRSLPFLFLSVSLPFHLAPRSYQSTTVVTIPAGAKESKPWLDLFELPIHPVT